MGIVRDILKRYLFEIICGVAAAAGIALIFVGLGSMSDVEEGMQQAAQIHSDLSSMASSAGTANPSAVEMERQRIEGIRQHYKTAMAYARELNEFKPLVESSFPTASAASKKQFQQAFQEEIRSWLGVLKAGAEPTPPMVALERDRMDEEKAMRMNLLGKSEKEAESDLSAEVRAALRNAHNLYMYATADAFQQSKISDPGGPMYSVSPPSTTEMWYAQLEIWLQRDIVDSLAAINEAAAAKLEKKDRWVANLPIKEVISLQTSMYYVGKNASDASARDAAKDHVYPPGTAEAVFTKHQPSDLYELLQFTVRMVVDERDLPAIIAGICRNRFHTPLRVQYTQKEPDGDWKGKIYGDAPLIDVTIDFETVMFSEIYLPLMPDEVLTLVGKQRPTPPEEGEGA